MSMPKGLAILALALLAAGCGGSGGARPEPPPPSPQPEPASLFQEPVKAEPKERAKVHTDLGLAYLKEGRFEIALEEANIAIEALASYAPAYNLKGLVHMALGQNEQADANFRQALRLAPTSPEINNNYGWFLCQTGKPKESFAYFNAALRNPLYQTPARAWHNMGVCALLDKDDANGETYLFRSLKLDPNNLRAYYLLADIGYRNKRYEDARDWLKQLHEKIEPTAESAWLALRVERKLGNREGEARFVGILRRKYRDAPEYQQMLRGEFD